MSDEVTYCAGHWLALATEGCWALVQLAAGDPRVDSALAALQDPRPIDTLAGLLAAEVQGAPGFAIVGRDGGEVRYAVRAPARVTAVVDEVPVFIDGPGGYGEWNAGAFESLPERAELANGSWGGLEDDQPLTGMSPARSVDIVFDHSVGSAGAAPAPAAAPAPSPAPSPAPAAPAFTDYTRQRPAGGWEEPAPPEPEEPAPVAAPKTPPSGRNRLIDGLPWRRKSSDTPRPDHERSPEPPAPPPTPTPTPTPAPTPAPPPAPQTHQPASGWASGPPTPPPRQAPSAPPWAQPTPQPSPPSPQPVYEEDPARTRVRGMPPVAPATPTPTPPPIGPQVWAVHCSQGHASPPYSPRCRICGVQLPPHQQPVAITRPPLGRLELSTGTTVVLDRGAVLGRSPRADSNQPGVPPHLVKIMLADISRLHAEVRLEDWQVLVRDLGSANGTFLTLPGHQPQQLRAMEEYALEPGSVVSLGGSVTFAFEVTA